MRRADERGSALLVALGILVLLSIMGVTFVILTRMEMQAAINFDNITRARFLAETGLQRAVAELGTLYSGPLFRPRFDNTPPTSGLNFVIGKPYAGTVAAHPSEPWGGRAVQLSGTATYTSLESMLMPNPLSVTPNPVSTDSAPYLWSGPQHGRLSDGYFDARFRGGGRVDAASNPYVDGSANQTFRVLRGVVDLNGLVNVNRANQATLEGLLTYFNIANPAQVATDIVNSRQDQATAPSPQRPFRYPRELVDRGVLTLAQLYGEDANGNGALDPGEDANANGVLDGALRDVITVFPTTGDPTLANYSAINVNSAPEPVLFAVFYRVLGSDSAKAAGLARAAIAYQAGTDRIEGGVSERDPDGDGTANPTDLTGNGTMDDLYSDDNPFDGIFDQVLYPAIIPAGATWLPEFTVGTNEWQDIDGDTVPPDLVAAASRTFDRWLFPNGPGGFSEFEHFMDNVNTWFTLTLTQQDIDYVKYNVTTRDDVTYPTAAPTPRVVTTVFRYDSDSWLVISEGRVEQAGQLQATVTMSAIVGYR